LRSTGRDDVRLLPPADLFGFALARLRNPGRATGREELLPDGPAPPAVSLVFGGPFGSVLIGRHWDGTGGGKVGRAEHYRWKGDEQNENREVCGGVGHVRSCAEKLAAQVESSKPGYEIERVSQQSDCHHGLDRWPAGPGTSSRFLAVQEHAGIVGDVVAAVTPKISKVSGLWKREGGGIPATGGTANRTNMR